MQEARARAAVEEGELLAGRVTELEAPAETTLDGSALAPLPKRHVVAVEEGTGFGSSAKASSSNGGGGGGGKKKKKGKGAAGAAGAGKKPIFKKLARGRELTGRERQALHQAAALRRDGCLRINGALRPATATRVRACVLKVRIRPLHASPPLLHCVSWRLPPSLPSERGGCCMFGSLHEAGGEQSCGS